MNENSQNRPLTFRLKHANFVGPMSSNLNHEGNTMTTEQTCTWICDSFLKAVDLIEGLSECYAENRSQHQAETAAFGDSWPGALDELREQRDALAEAEGEADAFARALGIR